MLPVIPSVGATNWEADVQYQPAVHAVAYASDCKPVVGQAKPGGHGIIRGVASGQ